VVLGGGGLFLMSEAPLQGCGFAGCRGVGRTCEELGRVVLFALLVCPCVALIREALAEHLQTRGSMVNAIF